jgi:O-antigen ligase
VTGTALASWRDNPFASYNVAVPILWLLGLINFAAAAIIVHSLLTRRSQDKAVVGIALLWYAVGVAQAISVVLAWLDGGGGLGALLHRLGSTTVTGWFVLGSLILIGPVVCRDNDGRLTRSFSIFGCYLLFLGMLSFGVFLLYGGARFALPSPLALLVPEGVGIGRWFDILLYTSDELDYTRLPRLVLFYPWPTILAYASVALSLICLGERRSSLRALAMAGALLALVSTASRAAFLAFVVALPVVVWLSICDTGVRALLLAAAGLPIVILACAGYTPDMFVRELIDAVNEARPGSSASREWVYQASLEAFWHRPVFGHGWPGEYVHPKVPIQLGSHSSFYGTLYTGGLVSLITMAVALSTTLAYLGTRAVRGERRHHVAFLIFFCLVVMSYGEGIYSFILPCAPIFGWMAGTMGGPVKGDRWRHGRRK